MSETEQRNANQLAVVTGAGHRLGRDIALKLAQLGYAVAVHYNQAENEALETKKCIENLGRTAFIVQADLTRKEQMDDLFSGLEKINIPLRVLVNSAAVMLRGRLNEFSMEEWDLTMDLNVRSVWWCSRLASDLMQKNGGVIINISDSGAGKLWTTYPAYSISKSGVETLTRMMAKAYAPNIRVNAVAPGLILPPDDFPEETWEKLVQRLPLKRPGTTEDICNAVAYILANDYLTGQVIVMDGGYQLV